MAAMRIRTYLTRSRERPSYPPRLALKPSGRPAGYLDGAWWPYSADLADELPDLLPVLTSRLGPVWRVVYDRQSWSRAPRRIIVDDRSVLLDAHAFELGNTMYLIGPGEAMLVLQVISSATDRDSAHATLTAAGSRRPDPAAHAGDGA
ncbi:DUF5994 family protein [Nocardia huaxiensis]|uniref:Uncharacterized protein n=1 Tax=Nocardia huaxiensis TaxID=2755382 RepID=A0A7D6VGP4_9NOCA|nr:DUF5994 family protein [Nocardia huaxiensis]QLY29250.1 hypothetical protein H0264_28785 [Nocardia huaxiensis]UFS97248.1 DUF5994 family protein [Nocardia huaxiensis]